jgi:uncharacterized protein YydD (DUF2326 family)
MFEELTIYENDKILRNIKFKKGLNIILADTDIPEASINKEADRNGTGKTLMIEIIDYCLFAQIGKRLKRLKNNRKDLSFSFELRHSNFVSKRYLSDTNKDIFEFNNKRVEDPKNFLRKFFWNINEDLVSFRQIFRYFLRYDKEKDFHSIYQKNNNKAIEFEFILAILLQIHNHELNKLYLTIKNRNEYRNYKTQINSAITNEFPNLSISPKNKKSVLAEKQILEAEVKDLELNLSSKQVLDVYTEMIDITNKKTIEIHEITYDVIFLKDKLNILQDTIKKIDNDNKPIIDVEEITSIYNDVGIILGDYVVEKLEKIKEFHKLLEEDNKNILEKQILVIEKDVSEKENLKKRLIKERHEIQDILDKSTSSDEYDLINNRRYEKKSKLKTLEKIIQDIESLDEKTKDIEKWIEAQKDIYKKNLTDHYSSKIEDIKTIFQENSKFLYGKNAGSVVIDVDKHKDHILDIDIQIHSPESEGKELMKLYCFDMMLIELWAKKDKCNCKLLIHDSPMFNGVDVRKIVDAIKLGKKKSEELDFQYILAINSCEAFYDELKMNNIIEDNDIIVTLGDKDDKYLLKKHFR